MTLRFPPARRVGFESAKAYERRRVCGFWARYVTGNVMLDIGYRGGLPDALPIADGAIGIERDTPKYDGLHLPFEDESADCVHASHVLEHVPDARVFLREWFRVLRTGGTMILFVPSAYLYERRLNVPPSMWSPEHVRAYTPATLLADVERALEPNSYRIRHCADCDQGYDYMLPPDVHPRGCLEIELVIQKIAPPAWKVEGWQPK